MSLDNTNKNIKYIKTKRYFASHPLYDAMKSLCNPESKDSGARYIYKNIEFSLVDTTEEYFDVTGKRYKKVDVLGLNDKEENWTVFKTFYEDCKETLETKYGRTENFFDANGRLQKSIEYDADGNLANVSDTSIDYSEIDSYSSEQLVKIHSNEPSVTIDYDDNGRVLKEYHREPSGIVSWIYQNFYNDNGELIRQEQAYYGDGQFEEHLDEPHYTLVSVFTREYNEFGHCILEYLYCEDGMQPDELTLTEYEYYN